jgi:hypothetical protein
VQPEELDVDSFMTVRLLQATLCSGGSQRVVILQGFNEEELDDEDDVDQDSADAALVRTARARGRYDSLVCCCSVAGGRWGRGGRKSCCELKVVQIGGQAGRRRGFRQR